jgi:hypothetical protein
VDEPSVPVVQETGGSTVEANWFDLATVGSLQLTEVTRDSLDRLAAETTHR